MRINFQCDCGQKYSAKPRLAGTSIACKKCEQTILVPDLEDDELGDDELHLQPVAQRPPPASGVTIESDGSAALSAAPPKPTSGFSNWLKEQLEEEEDQEKVEGLVQFFTAAKPHYFAIGLLAGAVLIGFFYLLQIDLDGRSFLLLYSVALAGIWMISEALRMYEDNAAIALPASLTFVGIGIARYAYGSAHGMHRFTLLYIMMAVGGVLILIGVKNLTGSTNGDRLSVRLGVPISVAVFTPIFLALGALAIFIAVILLLKLFSGESSGGFFSSSGCGGGCGSGGCGGGGCGGGGCGGGGCGGCGG